MDIGIREVVVSVVTFAVFVALPALDGYLRRRMRVNVLFLELAPLILPLIAVLGFYGGRPLAGIFGVTATVGYFAGLWWLKRSGPKVR